MSLHFYKYQSDHFCIALSDVWCLIIRCWWLKRSCIWKNHSDDFKLKSDTSWLRFHLLLFLLLTPWAGIVNLREKMMFIMTPVLSSRAQRSRQPSIPDSLVWQPPLPVCLNPIPPATHTHTHTHGPLGQWEVTALCAGWQWCTRARGRHAAETNCDAECMHVLVWARMLARMLMCMFWNRKLENVTELGEEIGGIRERGC